MGGKSGEKDKVVIVGTDLDYSKGGVATVLSLLRRELTGRVNLEFVSTTLSGHWYKKLHCFVYAVVLFLLKKFSVAHIHSSSNWSFYRKLIFVFIAKLKGARVLFHIHGAEFHLFLEGRLPNFLFQVVSRHTHVVLLGEEWRNRLNKFLVNGNYTVLPNPVDDRLIYSNRANVSRFLYSGRLEERKGVYDLLKAWSKFKDRTDVELVLAGDGEIVRCQKIISDGQFSNVSVVGWCDKLRMKELLNSSDALILPSYNEGLPMSVLEGASSGLVLVISFVGTLCDYFDDKSALEIIPGDIDNIKEKIELAINLNASEINQLTSNSRNRISSLSLENYIKNLLSIYKLT